MLSMNSGIYAKRVYKGILVRRGTVVFSSGQKKKIVEDRMANDVSDYVWVNMKVMSSCSDSFIISPPTHVSLPNHAHTKHTHGKPSPATPTTHQAHSCCIVSLRRFFNSPVTTDLYFFHNLHIHVCVPHHS